MKRFVLKLMSLITAGTIILSAPFTSFAAEMGEVSVGEPPIMEEEIELPPAIAMTPDGEIIYAPEEIPEDLPEPIEVEEPIIDGFENFKAMFGGMRYLYPEMSLEEYAQMYIDERTQYTTDPERIDYETRWVWTVATELYPEGVANEVSVEKWQYYDPWKFDRPIMLEIVSFHNDYEDGPHMAVREDYCGENQKPNQTQEPDDEWVEIAEPISNEVNGYTLTIHFMGKDSGDEPEPEPAPQIPDDPGPLPAYSICGEPIEYTVAKGDSLWAISEKLYGNGKYWFIIANTNADQISNPKLIYAGQTLIIPGVAFTR